jgi:uncharacterized membrane protein
VNGSLTQLRVTPRALKESGSRALPTALWLGTALVLSVILGAMHSPLTPLPGVVTILLIPGASMMSTLRTRPANVAARVVLAVCLSMMAVMVVGCVSSLLGPPLGIAQPLDTVTQACIWAFIALGVLVLGSASRRDPVSWLFEGATAPSLAAAFTSGLLVLISILGVAELNHSGNSRLAVLGTVLDAAVLVAGIVGGWRRDSKWSLTTLLYGASLALLLSTSLRGGHLFGWDVQQEFGVALNTVQAGVWRIPANHDPYASMLSLTVLPTILHSLVKLRLLAFFQLVVPAVLALLPVAIFASVRSVPRWVTSGRAAPRPGLALAVVSGIIVSSVAFSSDLVSITRQAMATTMLAALVMVMLDRTMTKRSSQVIIALLIIEISFTHYTTSYLLAAVLVCAWFVCLVWERGSFVVPRTEIEQHRRSVNSRRILSGSLVILSLVAAFGWNLGITRNYALTAPSGAVATKGVGLGGTTLSSLVPPSQVENLLIREFSQTAKYIVPVPGARLVHLVAATTPMTKGVVPSLATFWNKLDFIATEGIWLILGIALLYGVVRLGRRRQYAYTSDLVGLGVTGLLFGGLLRSSGTLSSFYNPERAAIITAILLATPATVFLDDLVSRRRSATRVRSVWFNRVSLGAVVAYVIVLVVGATGLGALLVGGNAPGSLSRDDVNVDNFTVSTSELATAQWLRAKVISPNIVQADLHGQLVLLSEPGSYDLINEIVPPEVDKGAYVYLSKVNLAGNISQASADNGDVATMYRSTVQFFNQHFYVVYSTGGTRVYH